MTTARWAMPGHDAHETERSIDKAPGDSQAEKPTK